ncbi:hypothetical protein BC834DRAFT_864712 [Gloeopeniophorella convolvens]|nr:hypothetical protein BC834DRAFT_864712 [Gloeopeniophorella convolvens]
MATLNDRPFSKDYSGLVNQSVIAACVAVICITAHELMKRKRRGKKVKGLGSVESWEFGYLYQGRSWASNPSPPTPLGWPLAWVREVIKFPESSLNELRGLDATVYSRFLRGCTWFVLLHTFTTVPILLPIHLHFSDNNVSPRSMTRASISSLAETTKGTNLLWIHVILLFYITISWVITLVWICRGAFRYRQVHIQHAAECAASAAQAQKDSQYHPHPHPQYPFQSLHMLDDDQSNRGLRLRTVMVSNVPLHLRSEKELAEYFEYYLSRPSVIPAVVLSSRPGLFNKLVTFVYSRARHILEHMPHPHRASLPSEDDVNAELKPDETKVPVISRVVIARKMTELASLLERREEVLRKLETAHIKLARKTLSAVKHELDKRDGSHAPVARGSRFLRRSDDKEIPLDKAVDDEQIKEELIRTLQPFVDEFGLRNTSPSEEQQDTPSSGYKTVWGALHAIPRSALEAYQPLIRLSSFFRGHTVPEIDYYITKLNLLSSLITENRARAIEHYDPVSTAFVTFADPKDARRACRYLASHPDNPMNCVVQMAPSFEDVDWTRVMKSTFKAEFLKDWVVNIGVWAFTLLWLFPVSLLVTLVSIQNISAYWPGLANYLAHHAWEEELLQSFLPTLLVSLLTLLIPLILLLIAKKAHTIITLSALHDRIMTRYYKFLIVNVLVFFCIGTAALQSFLVGFSITKTDRNVLQIVKNSFPSAGPFYVGWLIFTTAIHGGVELALLGLPLIMYPSTKRTIIPRKRNVRIRPRTFNYYYWLPNHLLVMHVLFVFAVLNPLVIPFGLIYFSIEKTVIKNQFLHVYAKNYEGNGQMILIRIIRYSLDGLMLAQAVFLAYMAVLKKEVNVALSAVLIVLTTLAKIVITRVCRAKFERDDLNEARIVCGLQQGQVRDLEAQSVYSSHVRKDGATDVESHPMKQPKLWATWRAPKTFPFAYATSPPRGNRNIRRPPIPFDNEGAPYSPVRTESPPVTEFFAGNALTDAKLTDVKEQPEDSLVSPHPPHPRWDDDSDPDHPYDNPYYTKTVAKTLWLPRNPCSLLDLDDTVDLSKALTSNSNIGDLGSWIFGSQRSAWRPQQSDGLPSPLHSSPPTSMPSTPLEPPQHRPSFPPLRQYSGREDILLPPRMALRIHDSDVEEVPVSGRLPSAQGRRKSSSRTTTGSARTGHTIERAVTIDVAQDRRRRLPSFRSDGRPNLGQPPYSATLPSAGRRHRSMSLDPKLAEVAGVLPDAHAQVDFLASVETPLPTGHAPEPSSVTPTEAVEQEVIVEEQAAAEERIRQEQEQAEKNTKEHRSWWTRWFFSRAET